MASSCFIGTVSSELSGKEIKDLEKELRRKYWVQFLTGIRLGYDPYEEPGEVPVVIGDWRD